MVSVDVGHHAWFPWTLGTTHPFLPCRRFTDYTVSVSVADAGWMRAVQVMVTLAMLQSVACVIIIIIYFIHCCPFNRERIFVLVSAILSFVSGKSSESVEYRGAIGI